MTTTFIEYAARGFELAGTIVMIIGSLGGLLAYLRDRVYHQLRGRIARAILLGLELLIAADMIATISVRATLSGVLVLGLIVLIRTFLSFTLELEATGRFPWQRGVQPQPPEPGAP